jgi:hypothetical protein
MRRIWCYWILGRTSCGMNGNVGSEEDVWRTGLLSWKCLEWPRKASPPSDESICVPRNAVCDGPAA